MVEVVIKFIRKSSQPCVEAVEVWGEAYIATQEHLDARDLDLKTIKVLLLTPVSGKTGAVFATKYVYHQSYPDNLATIYLWDSQNTEHTGSVWLDFYALGE